MLKVFVVILIGLAVGVAIELVLARRQRARRVVLDPPDLPPGFDLDLFGESPARRRPAPRVTGAPESSLVFDDDGGFRVLGPVEYDDALTTPWDRSGDAAGEEPARRETGGAGSGSGGSDSGQ